MRFPQMTSLAVIKSGGGHPLSLGLRTSIAWSRELYSLAHEVPYDPMLTALSLLCCRSQACGFLKRWLCDLKISRPIGSSSSIRHSAKAGSSRSIKPR